MGSPGRFFVSARRHGSKGDGGAEHASQAKPHASTISRLAVALAAVGLLVGIPAVAAADEAHLISYGAFGTTDEVVIRGRGQKGAPSSGAVGKGKLRKVVTTAHAFMRRDLSDAKILVTDKASGTSWPFQTDDDGFYDAVIPGPFPAGEREFEVSIGEDGYDPAPIVVKPHLVDAKDEGIVVVSDIDDTIADTGVTGSKVKLVKKVATSNAEDMTAYPHAADTLAAFAADGVPIIYVTAGPVDLAPRTTEFLQRAGFPEGAVFLRHYSEDGVGDPDEYKTKHIERILGVYAKRKLVFFGDNGEKDPELFGAIAKKSGRVAGTFIRATLAAKPEDERYTGQTLFETWGGAAQQAGKQKLIRWFAAKRIVLAEEEAAKAAAKAEKAAARAAAKAEKAAAKAAAKAEKEKAKPKKKKVTEGGTQ